MPVVMYTKKLQAAATDVVGVVTSRARFLKKVTVTVSDASATAGEGIMVKRRPSGGGGDVNLLTAEVDLSTITADTPKEGAIDRTKFLAKNDQIVVVCDAAAADAADDIVVRIEW